MHFFDQTYENSLVNFSFGHAEYTFEKESDRTLLKKHLTDDLRHCSLFALFSSRGMDDFLTDYLNNRFHLALINADQELFNELETTRMIEPYIENIKRAFEKTCFSLDNAINYGTEILLRKGLFSIYAGEEKMGIVNKNEKFYIEKQETSENLNLPAFSPRVTSERQKKLETQNATVLACLITAGQIYLLNIGDSKAIFFDTNKNELKSETIQHNVVSNQLEKERIEKAGAMVKVDRETKICLERCDSDEHFELDLKATRAFGNYIYKCNHLEGWCEFGPKLKACQRLVTCEPDILVLNRKNKDNKDEKNNKNEYLFMATGPFWDYMSNKEVIEYVKEKEKNDINNLNKVCNGLIQLFKSKCSASIDNVSLILIRLNFIEPINEKNEINIIDEFLKVINDLDKTVLDNKKNLLIKSRQIKKLVYDINEDYKISLNFKKEVKSIFSVYQSRIRILVQELDKNKKKKTEILDRNKNSRKEILERYKNEIINLKNQHLKELQIVNLKFLRTQNKITFAGILFAIVFIAILTFIILKSILLIN